MDDGKDLDRIALIDVCSEDDLLISSPFGGRRPPGQKQHCESPSEKPENISLRLERAPSPSDSPEIKRTASCKYNLRKSLAWDSAFFTSEGVLDPEELAVVNTTFRKVQLPVLPEITEDARKSAESSTTFDSDNWTAENTEIDLFKNLRASIQNFHAKYGKSPAPTNSSGVMKSRKTDAMVTGSKLDSTSCSVSKNVPAPSQVKIKPMFTPKKQSSSGRSLEKSNRIAGLQQVTKAAGGNGEEKLSLRPPKVALRLQATPSSGDSVSKSIHIKPNGTGNIPPLIASKKHTQRGQFNEDSRPTPSTTRFGTAKSRSTVSCSPNDGAVASCRAPVDRPPLHSLRKNVSSTSSGQRSSQTVNAHPVRASRDMSRRKNTNIVLRPANVSPTSSVESFASVSSSSSTSTARKPTTTSGTTPVYNVPHGPSGDKPLKPSGLKLPSPKIGYFDADKSLIRTANRSSGRQPKVTLKNTCEASTLSASSDSHCSDIVYPSATGSSVKSCCNTPEDARNSRYELEESTNNLPNFALELGDDGRVTPVGRRCLTLSEQGGEREGQLQSSTRSLTLSEQGGEREGQLQSSTRRTSVTAGERMLSGEGKQGVKEDTAVETKIHDNEKENMVPSAVELSVI